MDERLYTSKLWLSLILGFGAAVLGIGMVRGESSIYNYFELRESREVLASTVAELEKENTGIAMEINKIKRSSSYARKVLRDKYHVTEKGERIVFFAD
jgi:cell division protein FtsB